MKATGRLILALIGVAAMIAPSRMLWAAGGSGTPVDQNGRQCAQISYQKNSREPYSGHIRYDLHISNNCDATIVVNVIQKSDIEEDAQIRPGGTAKFFCTDGYKGNRDCNGGYKAFSSRLPRS